MTTIWNFLIFFKVQELPGAPPHARLPATASYLHNFLLSAASRSLERRKVTYSKNPYSVKDLSLLLLKTPDKGSPPAKLERVLCSLKLLTTTPVDLLLFTQR